MELLLKRIAYRPSYTIGRLYIDGKPFCNTLEDRDRGLHSGMSIQEIKRVKIPDETAIPKGTYGVTLDVISTRFSQREFYMDNANGGRLPRLQDVPGYSGVLIHVGQTAKHSSGCILVGDNTAVGQLTRSKEVFIELYRILSEAKKRKERITITIE